MTRKLSKNPMIRLLNQRVFFTFSIGELGRNRALAPRLGTLLAICGMFTAAVGFLSARVTEVPTTHAVDRLAEGSVRQLAAYAEKMSSLEEINSFQKQQLSVFARELGVLQARMERLDTIGERLFSSDVVSQYLTEDERTAPIGSSGDEDIELLSNTSVLAISSQLTSVERRSAEVERVLAAGLKLMERTDIDKSFRPHIWPVVHERVRVSSRYGWRHDPFGKRTSWHSGLDIAAAYNAPVVAAADGIVTFAGYRFGYGILVEIQHPGDTLTRYAHLNKASVVTGQRLKGGEMIGLMGSTGRSTGPHLHFEVITAGQKIDPLPLVQDGREHARMLALSQGRSHP